MARSAAGCACRSTSTPSAPTSGRSWPRPGTRSSAASACSSTRGGRRIALVEAAAASCPETIAVASVTYAPPRLLDGIKSLSYGANMLATRLAKEAGADEALLVTPHGRVLEAPTRAIFAVAGRHAADAAARPTTSSTRSPAARVLTSWTVEERPITLDELLGAEEAFLASTTHEVMPIHRVDDRDLPAAPGPGHPQASERRCMEHISASARDATA